MSIRFVISLILAVGAMSVGTGADSPQATLPVDAGHSMLLPSCATLDDAASSRFTVSDPKGATRFGGPRTTLPKRLSPRVYIVGGLIPTTNIAAQAGSLDPTIPAMAMTSALLTGAGNMRARQPHVAPAPPLTDLCPQR